MTDKEKAIETVLTEIINELEQLKVDSRKDKSRTGDYRIGLTKAIEVVEEKYENIIH